jgi:hypothetical protein
MSIQHIQIRVIRILSACRYIIHSENSTFASGIRFPFYCHVLCMYHIYLHHSRRYTVFLPNVVYTEIQAINPFEMNVLID